MQWDLRWFFYGYESHLNWSIRFKHNSKFSQIAKCASKQIYFRIAFAGFMHFILQPSISIDKVLYILLYRWKSTFFLSHTNLKRLLSNRSVYVFLSKCSFQISTSSLQHFFLAVFWTAIHDTYLKKSRFHSFKRWVAILVDKRQIGRPPCVS